MGSRVGIVLIAVGIAVLAATSIMLYLYKVTESMNHTLYVEESFNSLVALRVVVPQGASRPVISIVAEANEGSPLRVTLMRGNTSLATLTVDVGKRAETGIAVPGPGQYIVLVEPEGVTSKGAIAVTATYSVPALYTEASSVLGPAGSLAGFLAGVGVMYMRLGSKTQSSRQQPIATSSGVSGEDAAQGGSVY